MDRFNQLVSEQMETMDQLLYLQGEIERYKEREKETNESNCKEINQLKKELVELQKIFEKQTEMVIQSYQELAVTQSV